MVPDATCQAAGAEGAADIDIKTGFDAKDAEFADPDRPCDTGGENQSICAGKRVHGKGILSIL